MRLLISILLFLLLIANECYAQITQEDYIVLIIDIKRNDDLHPGDTFYWIAKSDISSKDDNFKFMPLFMKIFFSMNAIDSCCLGKATHFYSSFYKKDTSFDYPEGIEEDFDKFRAFLKEEARVVQKIKKEWPNKMKEKITISAIPITAELCSCNILDNSSFDSIMLPTIEFIYKLNNQFWDTKYAHFLDRDFSYLYPHY